MPRKTLEPIGTDVTDFVQALGLLVRRFRAVGGASDFSWTEAIVLRRLDKDGPATCADLAREVGVKPQSMGTTIAALEEAGMVGRRPHLTDGRQVNIELTAKGVAARKTAVDAKKSWLSKAVAQLDEEERETLFKAGGIMKRLAES
ncbi:MAG TPA: MarR family transcriptional regulator [bacterium]|jgi:DNA-binding MarR family transcriptional regulator|nr:MarR family transcriptional regulator [bacterium]